MTDDALHDLEVCPICDMPTDDPAHLIWDRVWASLIAAEEASDD